MPVDLSLDKPSQLSCPGDTQDFYRSLLKETEVSHQQQARVVSLANEPCKRLFLGPRQSMVEGKTSETKLCKGQDRKYGVRCSLNTDVVILGAVFSSPYTADPQKLWNSKCGHLWEGNIRTQENTTLKHISGPPRLLSKQSNASHWSTDRHCRWSTAASNAIKGWSFTCKC